MSKMPQYHQHQPPYIIPAWLLLWSGHLDSDELQRMSSSVGCSSSDVATSSSDADAEPPVPSTQDEELQESPNPIPNLSEDAVPLHPHHSNQTSGSVSRSCSLVSLDLLQDFSAATHNTLSTSSSGLFHHHPHSNLASPLRPVPSLSSLSSSSSAHCSHPYPTNNKRPSAPPTPFCATPRTPLLRSSYSYHRSNSLSNSKLLSVMPIDLLVVIGSYLRFAEICRLRRVCKTFSRPFMQCVSECDLRYQNVSDEWIASVMQQCGRLDRLNISFCPKITDAGVTAVVQQCTRLTTLNASYCTNISDHTIQALVQHCVNLTSLNVCGCGQVTDEGIRILMRRCANLKRLECTGCDNISEATRSQILSQRPGIRIY